MLFSGAAGLRKWMARGEIRILGARALRLHGRFSERISETLAALRWSGGAYASRVWSSASRRTRVFRRDAPAGAGRGGVRSPDLSPRQLLLNQPVCECMRGTPSPMALSAVSRKVKVMDIGQGLFLADRFFRLGYSEKSFGNWYRQGPRRLREVWESCSTRR